MKNIDLKMTGKGFLAGFVVLICISNIAAFAVSSDYWSQHPLMMKAGETKEFPIILQNLVGTSDLKLKAVINSDPSILSLADSNNIYVVPAGQMITVGFVATAPLDSEPGQVYPVKIDFFEVADSAGGEFRLGTAIGQGFDIVIFPGETAEVNRTALLYIILGVILLAIIIVSILIILKKRKSKSKGKGRK